MRLSGMRILLVTPLLLAVLFAASSGAAPSGSAAIAHPTARDKVVLRVVSGGGFVAIQSNLRQLPSFTLYGDGTVIVPGVVTMIYPGPAISPLVRSKLTERQVQALLARAKAAGLLAPGRVDYGDMGTIGIADAPTTTLTLNAGGKHIVRSAYALGISAPSNRMPAKVAAARRALAGFIAKLPTAHAGAHYTPHALAVYAAPFTGDKQPGASPVAWPLKRNLATAGKRVSSGLNYRCMFVGGPAAETLLAALARANEQTQWIMRGDPAHPYQLVVRPLLPDQRDCTPLGH
jgi:hypothetical protein